MFEGVGFLFPKLAFLIFFFLGCEALCPLKNHAIYFPRINIFKDTDLKPPLWIWMAKWGMIIMAIIALMSPVREIKHDALQGYDLLVVIDPQKITPESMGLLEQFLRTRDSDRIALWVPMNKPVALPMSYEHALIYPVLKMLQTEENANIIDRSIIRFFEESEEEYRWVVFMSDRPEQFVFSLPPGIQADIVPAIPNAHDFQKLQSGHPSIKIDGLVKYYEYYYLYPLFISFIFMLLYLYGRNQKGIR